MTSEEKEARFETLSLCLKKRDIFKARELLIENLNLYVDDKDFLNDCYHLVLTDSLIFQKHNDEMLDYTPAHWSEDMYPDLLNNLKRNFSRKRYHLAMELAIYFHDQKKAQEEENENELEIELKPTKKKRQKKPKRVIPLEEKYLLTGITTTTMLLIGMVIQLIIESE
ncbi:MAG: hypothetical protein Q4Q00_14305 [Turicibacter sp.]|nr:hypothetical protein [Turicibacter sp.]